MCAVSTEHIVKMLTQRNPTMASSSLIYKESHGEREREATVERGRVPVKLLEAHVPGL